MNPNSTISERADMAYRKVLAFLLRGLSHFDL